MIRIAIAAALLTLYSLQAFSQQSYWVYFTDKDTARFDPYTFFDSKTIERRKKAGIPLKDYTDVPVNRLYIEEVKKVADTVRWSSRWFNAVCVNAKPGAIKKIERLAFVSHTEKTTRYKLLSNKVDYIPANSPDNDTILMLQTKLLEAEAFKRQDISGQGVRIAVFDVGFKNVNQHPAFKHLYERNKIIATHDFVKNKEDVYQRGNHGTSVLSCLAGIYDSIPMGLAPDAEYLLARTERSFTEFKEEEDNWIAALEWAEQHGADIISSSLGYTYTRYFYSDMDGRTSLISKAALMAARKGLLVVTAAGNEGNSTWKYVATPGDADSVLTAGGINPLTGYHISFSSFGPTADGRMKPNVVAPAVVIAAYNEGYEKNLGTSFSTPLLAGFAACIWQMNKEYTNIDVLKAIQRSGHLYPYFDYAHGYGIPKATYFTDGSMPIAETFEADTTNDVLIFNTLTSNADSTAELIYYHFADSTNKVKEYGVIKIKPDEVLKIKKTKIPDKGYLRVHYMGHTKTYHEEDL